MMNKNLLCACIMNAILAEPGAQLPKQTFFPGIRETSGRIVDNAPRFKKAPNRKGRRSKR